MEISPEQAEKRLAEAVDTGDDARAISELQAIGRKNIEFTGRCYSLAITKGMVEASRAFGRAGFHLNVMNEPVVVSELAAARGNARGLMAFMQRYRYCKAQRTYYLPVVQAPASTEPIRALLSDGVGLTEHDCSELLSLSVRQDNVTLARTLVDGGAQLFKDIHDSAPEDLAGKMVLQAPENPWADQLSPRSSLEMIAFVIARMNGEACPVRSDWFKLYFRDPQFSEKLALIAPHASASTCEDAGALLAALARGGHAAACRAVLSWDGLDAHEFNEALEIARENGHVEIAAALLKASNVGAQPLAPLEF